MGTQGRERTLSEWQGFLQGSGFRLIKVLDVRTFAVCFVKQLVHDFRHLF
jgi:hypothetical protein